MRLWTEYEGETIDGAFALKKLLLPEGRSAFFSASNGNGDPAVLRLIECHFDEEEILARWRCVEALNHPHFLRLERYGQIELDGGPAVYAVFEKADANLADVLVQGWLSVEDTAQLAASLAAALDMLHTHGFVHEHVEAKNIFAAGEVVKLRSDCIREAPEGGEGAEAKQRDVRDLAMVVFTTLTQQQTIDWERVAALPAPFGAMVRNGWSGAWKLAEMRAALEGWPHPSPAPREPASAVSGPLQTPVGPAAAVRPPASPGSKRPPLSKLRGNVPWQENAMHSSIRRQIPRDGRENAFSLRARWLGVVGMLAILSLLAGWLVARGGRSAAGRGAPVASSVTDPAAAGAQAQADRGGSAAPAGVRRQGPQARAQWRVIAFTYNREDQAQRKAAAIAQKHPNLRPEVFTPNGHSPYLVTVGGVMTRDEALALARKLRTQGLPRDTYAQNYNGPAYRRVP